MVLNAYPTRSPVLRHPEPVPAPRPSFPLLAQFQALTVPDSVDALALAPLRATLAHRASTHPGHVADLSPMAGTSLLSLWRSADALRDIVHASHADLLAWRAETGLEVRSERVLWWVDGDHHPSPEEAASRMEHLRRYGPGAAAFTLRSLVPAPAAPPHAPWYRGEALGWRG